MIQKSMTEYDKGKSKSKGKEKKDVDKEKTSQKRQRPQKLLLTENKQSAFHAQSTL